MGEHVAPTTPAKKKRSNIFWNIVGVVGELLITFAIIVGLFSVWQLYWTTYEVAGQVSQTIALHDSQVEEWVTLADLLDAVSDAASNH